MTVVPDTAVRRVVELVKHGPPDGAGTPTWAVGMMLWWRMWSVGLLVVAGIYATAVPYRVWSPEAAVFAAYFIGLFVGGWVLKISPKYNVTKNY